MHSVINISKFKKPSWYICGTIIFFILAALMFTWRIWSSLSFKYPIDPAVWGQYGDFVGGTLGVVFSLIGVIFVVWTFHGQQKSAYEQRFNDLFFELLKMYQEQQKELQIRVEEKRGEDTYHITSNYKDFYERVRMLMFSEFVPDKSFSVNRKSAIALYGKICVPYKGKLSICYKTLYRILDMIQGSSLSNSLKLEYLKVLRAQLTESELLCLRYHIKMGDYRHFAYLINKYNILKHLPVFDMLEFAYWSRKENLSDLERLEIGNFFISLSKNIRKRSPQKVWNRCGQSLVFSIIVTPNRVSLNCMRRPLSPFNADNIAGLYKFSIEELENLLLCFLKEIVVFSNFSIYNNFRNLNFQSAHSADDVTITASVETINHQYLNISSEDCSLDIDSIPLLH